MSSWSTLKAGYWPGGGSGEGVAGLAAFHALIADHLADGDEPDQVLVGIETDRRGATHHQALRTLGNRLVGILHGCLRQHTRYEETTAWPAQQHPHTAAA